MSKGILGTNALNFPTTKFFKPPLSFRKPQRFRVTLDFVIKAGNQALSKLNAIPQREFHCISRESI